MVMTLVGDDGGDSVRNGAVSSSPTPAGIMLKRYGYDDG